MLVSTAAIVPLVIFMCSTVLKFNFEQYLNSLPKLTAWKPKVIVDCVLYDP